MPLPTSIAALVESQRAGRVTATELLDLSLARIERDDAKLHAWVTVDAAGARRTAEQLDRAARDGLPLGPLHGIPIGVKDLIDVAGLPTIAGAPWRRGAATLEPAAADAPLVARLRAAGAVILGKTVTTQLAFLDPPPTRNPWNLAHTPGGSSSGSAAAVAGGMVAGAVGTQTGGSILRPAAYCGLVGCKPTWGSVPIEGIVPLSASLDTPGPLARSVADAAVLLAVMQGRPIDDFAAAILGFTDSSTNSSAAAMSRAPRLGLIDEYFMAWADDDVQQAIETAAEKLHAAGARIDEISLPSSFPQVEAYARRLMAGEAAEVHRENFRADSARFAPQIAALVAEGLASEPADLTAAREQQQRFAAEMTKVFAMHSGESDQPLFLLTPTTMTPAPARLDTTGDARFNIPWSYARLPAVSIPCGLSSTGMPIGLQLAGLSGSEPELLAAAAWCEAVLEFTAAAPQRH